MRRRLQRKKMKIIIMQNRNYFSKITEIISLNTPEIIEKVIIDEKNGIKTQNEIIL